jgi:asparagine synthase (glutamine-hydrolysing)
MEHVVAATSVALHYVDVDADAFQAALPQILRAQDEPFGSASIVAQWFVFQRAKTGGMKVMLDGQGADETLAGYHFYFATIAAQQLAGGNLSAFWRLRAAYQREIGPFPVSVRSATQMLLARWSPRLAGLLRRNRSLLRLRPLSIALTDALNRPEWLETPAATEAAAAPSLGARLQQDVRSLVLPALLRYEDRNSMAHSLEARVPFLDYRLVEFVGSLPDQWKIRGTTTKYVLRQAMQGILPEGIRTRKDKIGFKADPDLTLSFFQKHHEALLVNQSEWERCWFRPGGIEALLNRYDGSGAAEFGLWRVLNTKLWARQFWS